MKSKEKSLGLAKIIFIVILLASSILGVVFSGIKLYSNIRYEVYSERLYHLKETATVITEKVENILDNNWSILNSIESILHQENISDSDDVKENLKIISTNTFNSNYTIALIDNQRQTYRSDKEDTYIFNETNLLLNEDRKQISLIDETKAGTTSNEYIIFLFKMANEVSYKSATSSNTYNLTHIALFFDTDSFADYFLSKNYSSQNQTLLLKNDGTRVYYDNRSEMFTEYNVLNVFKNNVEYLYDGSYEKLVQSISNGDVGSCEFKYNDEIYFAAYTKIQNQWTYITIVPEQYISVNSYGLVSSITNALLLFGGMIIAVLLLVIILIFYIINRNKQIKIKQATNLELQKANDSIKESEKKAIEANNAKSEFLSNMSHDIRTPINGIIGSLDVAKLHYDDIDHLHKCLNNIDVASSHLKTLINDILDMSRAESGKVTLTNEEIDIIELLESCNNMKQGQINNANLKYTTNYKEVTYPHVFTSPLHVRQVVLNILDNAIKYTPKGGSIFMRVKESISDENDKSMLTISISDTGIGMSEEFQKQIFEPFTRADNANSPEMRGTGLGMAIVKRLVTIMNGEVTLVSKLNEGSTFTISIPVTVDKNYLDKHVDENNTNLDDITNMRILLVEDNELNREIAKSLLEDAKAVVSIAKDGKEAYETFINSENNTYEAILMDIMMPVMDGIEATKAIRNSSHPQAKTIPIIAMTANAFAEDVARTKAAGMNEHLSKPIDFKLAKHTLAKYRKN